MLGKIEGKSWRGWQRMWWLDQTASPTQWTGVWTNSGRQWRTGEPGVLQSMGSQRVRHNLATEQQQTQLIRERPSRREQKSSSEHPSLNPLLLDTLAPAECSLYSSDIPPRRAVWSTVWKPFQTSQSPDLWVLPLSFGSGHFSLWILQGEWAVVGAAAVWVSGEHPSNVSVLGFNLRTNTQRKDILEAELPPTQLASLPVGSHRP